jgi:ABC-type nitrate/sulfonate/bicarbonate transport system substrate-binding protein
MCARVSKKAQPPELAAKSAPTVAASTATPKSSTDAPAILRGGDRPLRVGFIALNDAAPLIVAETCEHFAQQGLRVQLSREVGWATIRDKIAYRELDAAHALGAMVLTTALGLGGPSVDCLTACTLSTGGNCVTLSTELWQQGVRDAATLNAEIMRVRHSRQLVLGVVHAHSSHHILLLDWLRAGGVDPQRDVRIVVVPPAQLFRNLAAGTIDGYCVSDPWNTLAVREGAGWIAATSAELAPGHVDKVLMVRADFAAQRPAEHLALIAAVAAAARRCDNATFRAEELPALLAPRRYLDVAPALIAGGLADPLDYGKSGRHLPTSEFIQFSGAEGNAPSPAQAQWLLDGLARHGVLPRDKTPAAAAAADLVRRTFRADLHREALRVGGT